MPQMDPIKDNRKNVIPGSGDFSTKIPEFKYQQEWVMKMDMDCL